MFWFKFIHRLKSYFRPRKMKFASDDLEMRWLMDQGVKNLRCTEGNLTLEQRRRCHELTDRPFPDYMMVIK